MTTETAPIRKLYKRCKRGRHGDCPGSFEAHSVCECNCHGEAAAAVEAAQAIVTAPAAPAPTESPITRVRKFAAKRAAAAAAFVPEPDGTYVNHPPRYEADYSLRGVKDAHTYGFFNPCDEHATEENAVIIAFGRSETGSRRQVAAQAIASCLRGCDECRERTRLKLSEWAKTQGDVVQPYAYKYPPKQRPTRMSRETFIAKYDHGVTTAGVETSIVRCANRNHQIRTSSRELQQIILHDTDQPCAACVDIYKPRKRTK